VIEAIANVSADSVTAKALFGTIVELYEKVNCRDQDVIDLALVKCLIKMAGRAPVILEKTLKFFEEINCYEGIQILSRKYLIIGRDLIKRIVEKVEAE